MSGAAVVMIVAVVLIVLALVYYLVSTIVALRQITAGLDDVIAGVGEILEKSAPVNQIVNSINEQLDAGVDLLEGLLVKKAGWRTRWARRRPLPGRRRPGFRNIPESKDVDAPRIGEVYTKGTLTLARLGARRRRHRRARRPRAQERGGRQPAPRGCSTPRAARHGPRTCPARR